MKPVIVTVLTVCIWHAFAVPVTTNLNCPVPTTSSELGTQKVLDLHKIKGHKVRLQFFYPNEESSRRLLESAETTTTISPTGTIMYKARSTRNSNDSNLTGVSGEMEDTLGLGEIHSELYKQDIYCQWTFRVIN